MKKFFNQPFLHFLLIALIIFLWNQFADKNEKEDLLVSKQTQEFLFKQNERLLGRELSDKGKEDIINSFVQEELLLKMAYDRGLDKIDARIRESLIKNIKGILLSEVEEPHPDSLTAYSKSRLDKYAIRSAVDLLSISVVGENKADTVKIDSISYELLSASYGSRYAAFIFNLPVNILSQPIRNGESLIQFKVQKYYTDNNSGIDSIRLYEDYKFYKSQKAIEEAVDTFEDQFKIIIE